MNGDSDYSRESVLEAALDELRLERDTLLRECERLIAERDEYKADKEAAQAVSTATMRACLEAEKAPCVTRLVGSNDEHPICAYLRDGTKITVARDKKTRGPAWLEHKPQAKIGIAGE